MKDPLQSILKEQDFEDDFDRFELLDSEPTELMIQKINLEEKATRFRTHVQDATRKILSFVEEDVLDGYDSLTRLIQLPIKISSDVIIKTLEDSCSEDYDVARSATQFLISMFNHSICDDINDSLNQFCFDLLNSRMTAEKVELFNLIKENMGTNWPPQNFLAVLLQKIEEDEPEPDSIVHLLSLTREFLKDIPEEALCHIIDDSISLFPVITNQSMECLLDFLEEAFEHCSNIAIKANTYNSQTIQILINKIDASESRLLCLIMKHLSYPLQTEDTTFRPEYFRLLRPFDMCQIITNILHTLNKTSVNIVMLFTSLLVLFSRHESQRAVECNLAALAFSFLSESFQIRALAHDFMLSLMTHCNSEIVFDFFAQDSVIQTILRVTEELDEYNYTHFIEGFSSFVAFSLRHPLSIDSQIKEEQIEDGLRQILESIIDDDELDIDELIRVKAHNLLINIRDWGDS